MVRRNSATRSSWATAPEARICAIPGFSANTSVTVLARKPSRMPSTANPTIQEASAERCSRRARPHRVPTAPARAGPGRGGTRPIPKSRRAWSARPTPTRTSANPTTSASGHQMLSTAGLVSWSQPNGVSHAAQSGAPEESM